MKAVILLVDQSLFGVNRNSSTRVNFHCKRLPLILISAMIGQVELSSMLRSWNSSLSHPLVDVLPTYLVCCLFDLLYFDWQTVAICPFLPQLWQIASNNLHCI